MSRVYNDPAGGAESQIGEQFNTFKWEKNALIEARKEQYFIPMSGTIAMPKHFGKTIKKFLYLPMLDDKNVNDQGIDAAGVTIVAGTYDAFLADGSRKTNGAGANGDGSYPTEGEARTAAGAGGSAVQNGGNLYGSSKDVGAITGKIPLLSETGGRVNRVGFKRTEVEGSIEKMGFFDEYTQDSMDFDTDADLMMHINREMVNGAVEITEDMLQIDLLNSAGVLKFAGAATQDSEVDDTCNATYGDLMRLSIDLDNTRTPKHTNVITGTRMTDTKTINAARVMFIGSELLPLCKGMKDLHNNPAFVSVEKYAAAGTTMNGEVGSIDQFRIVVVPEMLKWEGKGADASATTTHYETGDNYDVFPMLVIGDGSFTTIGFQTDGKTTKFKIINKPPGEATADRVDPYGETGFMAIKWWYGFLLERAERIGLIKTAGNL